MNPRAVRHLVIAGGGVAAWMMAAALGRALAGTGRHVTLVEPNRFDHGVGPAGGVEASLPTLTAFLPALGLDENALVDKAQASFSLGTRLLGWAGDAGPSFLPFGSTGAPLGPVAFHQLVMRLRAEGRDADLTRWSLAALAAEAGRFGRPSSDPRSPLSTHAYGLHVDLDGFTSILREAARRSGVMVETRQLHDVRMEGGDIAALVLEDGNELVGDFFIDCTGSDALLARHLPQTAFESWSQWLPCDRMLSVRAQSDGASLPYAHHSAVSAGWRRSVPLSNEREESLFYSSAHQCEETARASIAGGAEAPVHSFEPGMRRNPWAGNCLAVGSSAITLDPLTRTGLHLVQSAIERFLRLFPTSATDAEATEYNRLAHEEAERVRDFAILPYKLNGRHGEAMWDACRAMEVPDSLAYKIDLYRSRGRVPVFEGETFARDDWVMMFDSLGVRPRRHDPLADGIPLAQIERHLSRMHEVLRGAAQSLPLHGDYLRMQSMRRSS